MTVEGFFGLHAARTELDARRHAKLPWGGEKVEPCCCVENLALAFEYIIQF